MIVLAVDPGLSGAIALMRTGEILELADMPTCPNGQASGSMRTWMDAGALHDMIRGWRTRHELVKESVAAVIERPFTNPRLPAQTIAGQFDCVGALRGALGGYWPVSMVEPQRWKKIYGLGSDKGRARQIAVTLYGSHAKSFTRVKDDGRADAVLIGHYWLRTQA